MNLAIITARGGSKRIPRKNIRLFCGKPIIAYSIETALKSECFDEVMVSTDDQEISDIAQKFGAQIPFLRSSKNSNDYSSTAEVILEVLNAYYDSGKSVELACCIYPTAPFVTVEALREGKKRMQLDSSLRTTFPVTRFSYPIQRALMMKNSRVSMFQPEHILSRSQDLEPAYHDAGQFYWLRSQHFLKNPELFTEQSAGIVLPETHVQDIDNEADWELAEIKFQRIQSANL